MRINEVCKKCGLTKKAIEYYEEQGLIVTQIAENGYREFSDKDVVYLSKVAILRRLGLSVSEIKAVLQENGFSAMQNICEKKALALSDMQVKRQLMQKLTEKQDWEYIRDQLDQHEKKQTILARLLDCFPGYYGKLISLHFAPYLNEPILTEEQQKAFDTVIAFLDGVIITIPKDLRECFDEVAKNIDDEIVKKATESIFVAIQAPEQYLKDNEEMLKRYEEIRASSEYKNTPVYRLQQLLVQLNRENGYNDIFIPAMQRLSRSYREYYEKLMKANEIYLERYKN